MTNAEKQLIAHVWELSSMVDGKINRKALTAKKMARLDTPYSAPNSEPNNGVSFSRRSLQGTLVVPHQ